MRPGETPGKGDRKKEDYVKRWGTSSASPYVAPLSPLRCSQCRSENDCTIDGADLRTQCERCLAHFLVFLG